MSYRGPTFIYPVLTGRVDVEKDFIDVQVPLNEIWVAIARWNEEEQTSTTTFVAISELVIFMVIFVLERFLTYKVSDYYPATIAVVIAFSSSFRCSKRRFYVQFGRLSSGLRISSGLI